MKNIKIFPLSEGVFTIGHDKVFVPFEINKDKLNERPTGSLLVEVQPFLIQYQNKNYLLDTGLGFKNSNGDLQIYENLKKHKVSPNDIDYVILSHLHKDHAGGIAFKNEQNTEQLAFPNARYYVNKNEFEFALQKGYPSYHIDDFELLKNDSRTEWLDVEGKVFDFVHYQENGGHCPHHTTFLFSNNLDQKVFFGGDVAPQLRQLKTKYIAKYDYDGKKSMELRQQFAATGKEEKWQFLFYHDVTNPIGIL